MCYCFYTGSVAALRTLFAVVEKNIAKLQEVIRQQDETPCYQNDLDKKGDREKQTITLYSYLPWGL
ncbi:hypothetical protein [Bartonella taylorii]|uniref:hypothetical protein n=1 Tax=Bartonella taylorii TaxID=33046 RepID=UPI001ABB221E|nr:hypothetical protein [Bartonella taylorii]